MANEPATGAGLAGEAISVEAIDVEVIEAWPHEFRSRHVRLGPGATVADALAAAGIAADAYPAVAVFGERVTPDHALVHGDRVELLRPLQADPKDARRRRAAAGKPGTGRAGER